MNTLAIVFVWWSLQYISYKVLSLLGQNLFYLNKIWFPTLKKKSFELLQETLTVCIARVHTNRKITGSFNIMGETLLFLAIILPLGNIFLLLLPSHFFFKLWYSISKHMPFSLLPYINIYHAFLFTSPWHIPFTTGPDCFFLLETPSSLKALRTLPGLIRIYTWKSPCF